MTGIFSTPFSADNSIMEAVVMNVDPKRFVCSVRTIKGQTFNGVTWMLPAGSGGASSMHMSPTINDRVVVSTALGYPLIVGALPRIGVPISKSISGQGEVPDTGNSSEVTNGYVVHPDKPEDFTPGDHVTTTEGGAVIAAMVSGNVLMKSSPLSQILLSKFDDLCRVVGRNYQRFSDASTEVSANIRGRLYRFLGVDTNLKNSQSNNEIYNEVIGDVAAGEYFRGEPDPLSSPPAKDSRIKQEWLNKGADKVMVETLDTEGNIKIIVNNGGTTTVDHQNSLWQSKVVNGVNAVITINPTAITIDFNGVSTAVFDASHVNIKHGSSNVDITDSHVLMQSSGHQCGIDSTGVHFS